MDLTFDRIERKQIQYSRDVLYILLYYPAANLSLTFVELVGVRINNIVAMISRLADVNRLVWYFLVASTTIWEVSAKIVIKDRFKSSFPEYLL